MSVGRETKAAASVRIAGRGAPHALAALTAGLALAGTTGQAGADAVAGEAVFKQCSGCHMVGPDAAHRFGPHLNGLLERGAGGAEGYEYSGAFEDAVAGGLAWPDGLDGYLEAPMELVPGTKMAYPGLKSAEERADVIEYLAMIGLDGELPELRAPAATDAEQAAVSGVAQPDQKPIVPPSEAPIPEHGVLHLGRPALEEEVAAWDIDVRPDGEGLPEGSGDVLTGTDLYDAQCAACHGVFGEGEGRWPMLAGGFDTLSEDRPEKTIGSYWPYLSTVYDYVRRAMPYGNARSLSDDDVYAITAYLLYLNDLVDEDFTLDSTSFAEIEMPNAESFIEDTRPEERFYGLATETEPCMSDCADGPAEIVQTARVLDVTPDSDEGGAGAID